MSIPSWARAGVEVECIDVSPMVWMGCTTDARELTIGARYKITSVNAPWLRLNGPRGGYRWERFRPLVPQKTEAEDVAHIKALLRSPKASTISRERADA